MAEPGRVTATIQANLRRCPEDARRLAGAGIGVRLVKGAYLEHPADAIRYGQATDLAYLRLANAARQPAGRDPPRNAPRPAPRGLPYGRPGRPVEMRLGVRAQEARALAAARVPLRLYVPFGDGWFRYGMRRLAEARGA